MRQKEEKRNARRIRLQPPVAGSLSHFPISIIDLSSSGARIQHDAPLTFQPGKRFILEFACEGERFRVTCTVARSRMEMNPTQRTIYTTGVRFTDLDDSTTDKIWGLIGFLAVDTLAHETLSSEPSDFDFELITH
jgi:hypothetical protein